MSRESLQSLDQWMIVYSNVCSAFMPEKNHDDDDVNNSFPLMFSWLSYSNSSQLLLHAWRKLAAGKNRWAKDDHKGSEDSRALLFNIWVWIPQNDWSKYDKELSFFFSFHISTGVNVVRSSSCMQKKKHNWLWMRVEKLLLTGAVMRITMIAGGG